MVLLLFRGRCKGLQKKNKYIKAVRGLERARVYYVTVQRLYKEADLYPRQG